MRQRARLAAAATGVAAAAALLAPAAAQAHALVGRKDLPIPAWLFAWGASVVLIVSFFILSFAWHKTRFEEEDWRPVSDRLSRAVLNPYLHGFAGALARVPARRERLDRALRHRHARPQLLAHFPLRHRWIGFVIVSVAFGDVFRAFNPWRAIARVARRGLALLTGQEPRALLRYPERLGRWPAAAGVAIFVWIELVSGASGFQAVGVQPRTAAIAVLLYTAYTLVAMALFGIEKWLERGETFSVYFGMFSRLSALEVRDRRLGVRRWLSGRELGGGPGLPRDRPRDHRGDDLRRRAGGHPRLADLEPGKAPHRPRAGWLVRAARRRDVLARSDLRLRRRHLLARDQRHAPRPRLAPDPRARAQVHAHADSNRARLRASPITSASSSSRSRRSSPTCSPTRSETARTTSGR